uniref:Uncharacterized protein n=1 Tax=Scophthalmus maximus TaxID=52904 RepID=A0A8D3BD31_SCOMX
CSSNRPPNRSDGALTAREESGGGDSASAQRGEPESPARCRTKSTVDTLGVFRKRSIFAPPRRSSSGYFSFDGDSLPLSPRPVATADRATQTPSPAGQAMEHALQRMAEARGGRPGTQQQRRHGELHVFHRCGVPMFHSAVAKSPFCLIGAEVKHDLSLRLSPRRVGFEVYRCPSFYIYIQTHSRILS